jgi:hypothetical protein
MSDPSFYIFFSITYTILYLYLYTQIQEYKERQRIIKESMNRLQIIEINVSQ